MSLLSRVRFCSPNLLFLSLSFWAGWKAPTSPFSLLHFGGSKKVFSLSFLRVGARQSCHQEVLLKGIFQPLLHLFSCLFGTMQELDQRLPRSLGIPKLGENASEGRTNFSPKRPSIWNTNSPITKPSLWSLPFLSKPKRPLLPPYLPLFATANLNLVFSSYPLAVNISILWGILGGIVKVL